MEVPSAQALRALSEIPGQALRKRSPFKLKPTRFPPERPGCRRASGARGPVMGTDQPPSGMCPGEAASGSASPRR